jgi:hypothetical protein
VILKASRNQRDQKAHTRVERGSDDLDRYALEYCRSCRTAHAQILLGLRSDANIREALDAMKQDRVTIQDHVFEYSQGSEGVGHG